MLPLTIVLLWQAAASFGYTAAQVGADVFVFHSRTGQMVGLLGVSLTDISAANLQAGPSNVSLCIRPDNAFLPLLDPVSRALITGAASVWP